MQLNASLRVFCGMFLKNGHEWTFEPNHKKNFSSLTSIISCLSCCQSTFVDHGTENMRWQDSIYTSVVYYVLYKLATITYKSLSVAQPTYLYLLLQRYEPTRSLRSGSQYLLALPTLSSEFGRHAFSYCASSVWNELSLSIRSLNSFNSFISHLKTRLFARH